MIHFLFILSFILFILFIPVLLFIVFIWLEFFRTGFCHSSPMIWTNKKDKKEIFAKLETLFLKRDSFLELGCGIGSVLYPLAKKYPNKQFYGVEWGWPYYIAKWRCRHLKNVHLYKQDFFQFSFKGYDIIYSFILQKFMDKITLKIMQDAKDNVVFLSLFFKGNLNIMEPQLLKYEKGNRLNTYYLKGKK